VAAAEATKQEFTFQAEIKQLLHLLSHSLYQNREITIRELISNASDALDKLRHIQLTEATARDEAPLGITLETFKEERILVIRDNGIGMTREELVRHLGTIAHSGSLEFINKLSGDAKKDVNLIGQFGVGFYSAFMLADQVEVLTRSYQGGESWRWTSDGSGSYAIEAVDEVPRGTQVRLHLKADLDEFLDPQRLKVIIRKYSAFVPHPIRLADETLNDQKPIWVEPKSDLTEEKYEGFYQHLTHRFDGKPLWYVHFSSDSPLQFNAILYCPESNFEQQGFGRVEHGVHLCAKRILVQDNNRDLLPEYLRFLYGLVDSADLPLNVSRESLQDNTIFRKLKKVLTKKVLDHLDDLSQEDPAKYKAFYKEFGSVLREGIGVDFENRDRVAKLLRFRSSHDTDPEALVSLDDYVKRAHERQKQIYFCSGTQLETLQQNPNLEIFRRKKLEVLYLTDPVDEIALQHLHMFAEKRLISIDAADVEFPEGEDEAQPEGEAAGEADFGALLKLFTEALGEKVTEVKESKRLTDSPCCLVNSAGAMSTQLQKMLMQSHNDFEASKRVLELNRRHSLIRRLSELTANDQNAGFIQDCGRQLFANALILAGLAADGDDLTRRVERFMDELAQQRSVIVS